MEAPATPGSFGPYEIRRPLGVGGMAETSVAVRFVKRFYRVEGRRGSSLAFEGREDVFWRVNAWADVIASTLEMTPDAVQ